MLLMLFGSTLADLRRRRGWSQQELALRAGLSQRHISFLETGRSRPGQHSLRKLADALALRGWEQSALFGTLAPAAGLETPRSPDRHFITDLMNRFSRWPAYIFHPDGSLVAANAAMRVLLGRAAGGEDLWRATAPPTGPNIYDLVFHPDGLLRWMVNPQEVIPETLRRLRVQAAHEAALSPVVRRMENYPSARKWATLELPPPSLLIERYRVHNDVLSIVSMLSHFASPGELELDMLRLESFVPADSASEKLLLTE